MTDHRNQFYPERFSPRLTDKDRLYQIARIIEQVDTRCLRADGPVTPILQEMTQDELSRIYALALGKDEDWRPNSSENDMEKSG